MRSGKVRHIGCSNWTASQLADALDHCDRNELAVVCSVQPRYTHRGRRHRAGRRGPRAVRTRRSWASMHRKNGKPTDPQRITRDEGFRESTPEGLASLKPTGHLVTMCCGGVSGTIIERL